MMQDFKQLKVWEKSHALTLAVYTATQTFPKGELYGLTSQLRRATSSIPANIAEGCGRNSGPELRRFLEIAMGSASECEYHLLLSRDLELLTTEVYEQLHTQATEIKRMLAAFIAKLKTEN
jgi:four helix bundle protein